ncbi:MAG: signal peptidase II [Mycoplasmataceae bacterium]|jgi:lipoprotein signal peptidase|nr:signal peptidase II [Mycoplasmataceae bacterium]
MEQVSDKKQNDIWNKFLKYLKNNFSKKNNLWRLFGFAIALVVVLVPSLTCNLMIRNGDWQWPHNIAYNDGIAFSALVGKTALIYFLQAFICFIVLLATLFTDKWYHSLLLSLALVGGLFNLIDRATQPSPHLNTVIDYLPTGNTTSNFPDVFILTGVIGFSVLYVIITIYGLTKRKNKQDKNDKNKS